MVVPTGKDDAVSEDLGTWSPVQAEAIHDVLHEAGVEATLEEDTAVHIDGAQGTAPPVRVIVPSDQAARAHQALAAQMTRVAQAAEAQGGRGGARHADAVRAQARQVEDEPPLVLEQLRNWGGGALALIVVVFMVIVEVPGPARVLVAFLTLAALVGLWWWGRDEPREDRYGPGA